MSCEEVSCAELINLLEAHKKTIAVAESLTGGLLAAAFVEVPGASHVFRGGVCTYATDTKHSVWGVSERRLAATGPVDPEVAKQMAMGVRSLMDSDFALSTTGVAGPGPSDGHPAGTVFVACAWNGGSTSRQLNLSGERDQVRAGAVCGALALLSDLLKTELLASAR